MSGIPVALAVACALLLGAAAWCCLGTLRVRALLRAWERQAAAVRDEQETAVGALRQDLERLSGEFHERRAAPACEPAPPRRGVNLNKRAQALRLHRRGETPRQIAEELEIPVQEVKLLLKVHDVVIRAI